MGSAASSRRKDLEPSDNFLSSGFATKVNERDLVEYYENALDTTSRKSDKHGRALVVDDSKFNRKMLSKTIEDFFTDIGFAENGLEAIEKTKQAADAGEPFSIIFMDSMMPVMGGIESTAKIREMGFTGLIIGVTGDITAEDNQRFLACGVNDVILKPLLLPHVESILMDLTEHEKNQNQKAPRTNAPPSAPPLPESSPR